MASSGKAAGPTDSRTSFLTRIRERLAPLGIDIVSADLGRSQQSAVWVLAVVFPNQTVVTLQAPVADGDPYSAATADDVSVRVMRYVQRELRKIPPGA